MVLQLTLAQEARRRQLDDDPGYLLQLDLMLANWLQPKYRSLIAESVSIDSNEVERIYRILTDKPPKPRKVRLYNIYKRFPPDADEDSKKIVREAMQQIVARLESGGDFKQLASDESESQSRLKKGLIGNVPAGFLRPEIDRVAMSLKQGEVSGVIETADGLTLLFAESIIVPPVLTESILRDRAEGRVRRKAFDKAWQVFQDELQSESEVKFNWSLLDQQRLQVAGDDAVVATFSLGEVTMRQARWLLAKDRESAQLSENQKEALESRIMKYVSGRVAISQVDRRLPCWSDELERIRDYLGNKLLSERMLLRLVNERFEPLKDAEVAEYFRENSELFVRPEHFRLSVLTWKLDPNDPRLTYKEASQVLHRLRKSPERFDNELKQHVSVHGKQDNGDLGWISRPNLAGKIGIDPLKAVLKLSVGDISELTRSDDGRLWIIHLADHEAKRPYRFEEADMMAKQSLGQQRMGQTELAVIDDWLTRQAIEKISSQ